MTNHFVIANWYSPEANSSVTAEEQQVGFTYSMGDLTFAMAQAEDTTADAVTADVTAVGVHYSMGGGVTAFIENTSDDRDADKDTTAVGLTMKF